MQNAREVVVQCNLQQQMQITQSSSVESVTD